MKLPTVLQSPSLQQLSDDELLHHLNNQPELDPLVKEIAQRLQDAMVESERFQDRLEEIAQRLQDAMVESERFQDRLEEIKQASLSRSLSAFGL